MNTTTARRWWVTLGALTVAGLLSLAVAVMPASGQATVQATSPVQATVKVVSAALVAKGAAVDVTVEYQCLSEVSLNSLNVVLSQRSGKAVSLGSGWVDFFGLGPCAGLTPQQTTVRVFPSGTRFKKGEAAVSAELSGFSSATGAFFVITNDQVVDITNR